MTLRDAVNEVSSQFDGFSDQIAMVLPDHISPQKFKGVLITAVNLNPALLKCDRRSLFNACYKAAADGLLPDGREGALIVQKQKIKGPDGKDRYIDGVRWDPMVFGILKKIRQSGEISSVGARIVYHNETISQGVDKDGNPIPPRFRYIISGGEERIEHEPILWGDRGAMVGVYAYAKFKDGTEEFEPMNKADVEKIRAVSRATSGPWVDWYEQMAKKSAIKRLAKRLPLTADIMAAVTRDDETTEIERIRAEERRTVTTAMQQLGAPDAFDNIDPAPAEDENQSLAFVQELVARAIKGLDDPENKVAGDLDEYAQHIRDRIRGEEIGDALTDKFIEEFNSAYMTAREKMK